MAALHNLARGAFHARIRAMEPGVFRPEYSGEMHPEQPDAGELPAYHAGTSVADVQIWVEQMARSLGYARVAWDELPQ